MGALAPLAPKYHGASFLRIEYSREGERRSVTIPGIASMGAEPVDTATGAVAWVSGASPIAPEAVALARAVGGSTYTDHGLRWDNSGKNAHFAPIKWSNA